MKKGDIVWEHVAIILILLALLVVLIIYGGVLRSYIETMMQKFLDFIAGG